MPEVDSNPVKMESEEFALRVAGPEIRIGGILFLVAGGGLLLAIRDGWQVESILLIVGAVIAFGATLLFGRQLIRHAEGAQVLPSVSGVVGSFAGFLPLLLGYYLVFYKGVWGIWSLTTVFTFGHLMASVLFMYLGYRLVVWTYVLSEIAEALRTGAMSVGTRAGNRHNARSAELPAA